MSTKQKKTIQKGSFKRLLKLFFFKNKMLTALMLFSIIISAVATAPASEPFSEKHLPFTNRSFCHPFFLCPPLIQAESLYQNC